MALHLIITRFQTPELPSTASSFSDYAMNSTSKFICLLLLPLLLCAYLFHPFVCHIAPHCTFPPFHLPFGKQKNICEALILRELKEGGIGWTDKCVCSRFLTERWRKQQWQGNHEKAPRASKLNWQTSLKYDAFDQGKGARVRVRVCDRER